MFGFSKMIFYYITVFARDSTSLQKKDSIDFAIDNIQTLNPCRITILQSQKTQTTNYMQSNLIFEKLTGVFSTFVVDISDTNSSSLNIALNTDLYVMIEFARDFNVQRIVKNLNSIAELNALPPRAKFLIILIDDSKSTHVSLKQLFTDAWALKFIDFTNFDHK